jgi:hypothetical protein
MSSDSIVYDANKRVLSGTLSEDITSGAIPLLQFHKVGLQVSWTNLDQADAELKVSVSNDGILWDNTVLTSAVILDTATDNQFIAIDGLHFTYLKVDVTHGTCTQGDVFCLATFKE